MNDDSSSGSSVSDFAQGLSAKLRGVGAFKQSLEEPSEKGGKLAELEGGGGSSFSLLSETNDIELPFTGWEEDESGGSVSDRGHMTSAANSLLLEEGDSFIVAAQQEITIPENPGKLIIPYSVLSFDTEDPDSINDAFEIALLGSDGYSVVPTVAGTSVDVFFNFTEGLGAFTANGATHAERIIELDISGLAPGSTPLLVLRLVNNDSDEDTFVQFGGALTVDDAEVVEGNTGTNTLEYMVRLTHPSEDEVSVNYQTVAGTATASTVSVVNDFTHTSGTLVFEPGQTELPVEVSVEGEYLPEEHETVFLQLSSAVGAAIRDNQGTGTITNDDGIEITGAASVNGGEGTTAQQTTYFTDLDTSATHTAVIYWGDGSDDTMTVTESGGSGQAHYNGHIYADNGLYEVRVEITNNHGVTVHNDTQIGVGNWTPQFDLPLSTSAIAGEDFPSGTDPIVTFRDLGFTSIPAGTSETFSAMIDWGDGSSEEEGYIVVTNGGPGVDTVGEIYGDGGNPHIYATAGTYELTITLTDDDEGEAIGTWDIEVEEAMQMMSFLGGGEFFSDEEFSGPTLEESGGGAFLFSMISSEASTNLISLSASLPSDRVATGTELLLSGHVTPVNDLAGVMVNGLAVEVLDAAGNFYTRVQVAPGINTFEVVAIDTEGETASLSLDVEGTQVDDSRPDFEVLEDVSASITPMYTYTTFNERVDVLTTGILLENTGRYSIDAPLLLGIRNISDPRVALYEADGVTPEGIYYYDISHCMTDGKLSPQELTADFALRFFNPARVQFTYELVILGVLNRDPAFTTPPRIEAFAGSDYNYNADALDPDSDPLTYTKLVGPAGMSVNATTGLVEWEPTVADIGNHLVVLKVDDGRGGTSEQPFVIAVHDTVPNRPPYFTTTPTVEAYVNMLYEYPGAATDPDADVLTYQLLEGPAGMTLPDDSEGRVRWVPTADQLGTHAVRIEATDGRGGMAVHEYDIFVMAQPGNHPPVIVSDPRVRFEFAGEISVATDDVTPNRLSLRLDAEEAVTRTVSVTLPEGEGMSAGMADIVFVVDESGSMEEGHTWLGSMVLLLEEALGDAGVTDTRFGLVGFGATASATSGHAFGGTVTSEHAHRHEVGDDSEWGTATELAAAILPPAPQLSTFGFDEDGYEAISLALDYDFREGAAVNIVLVTDEDRDIESPHSYSSILADLASRYARLNVVVDAEFGVDATGTPIVLGAYDAGTIETPTGTAYIATEVGGFDAEPGAIFLGPGELGDTTVYSDYVTLAWARNGIAWNFDILRQTGSPYDSFTNAFVAVKAAEILEDLAKTVDVIAVPTDSTFGNLSGQITGVLGETIEFDIEFTGDGLAHAYDLKFIDVASNEVLGSIPVTINNDYVYDVHAIDPDDDPITYSFGDVVPAGATINSETGIIDWIPPSAGNYDFSVIATDGRGGRDEQAFSVTVVSGNANVAPEIDSTAPDSVNVGELYYYQVQASDDDADKLSYFLADSPPAGISIDRDTGVVTWNPASGQVGPHSFEVQVLDGRGGADTEEITITVQSLPTNANPVIGSTPSNTIIVGDTFRYGVTASDSDGDQLTFDLPVRPVGMAIDATTGRIAWDPMRSQRGTQDVLLRVRDGHGGHALQSFQITVSVPNSAPFVISNPPSNVATTGDPFEYQVFAIDPDFDELEYSLVSGSPSGMTIDSETGRINWTPASTGSYSASVLIDDSRQGTVVHSFELSVVAPELVENLPPIIHSDFPRRIQLGTTYVYLVDATDPDGDPLSFALTGTVPSGMTIESERYIVWTPQPEDLGTHTGVSLEVDDGQGHVISQPLEVEVDGTARNAPPRINSIPPVSIVVRPDLEDEPNQTYEYHAIAEDPDNDPITWSLELAPDGMVIDSATGQVRWTPQLEQLGNHDVLVQATDSYGSAALQGFTVTAFAINRPPRLDSAPPTSGIPNVPYVFHVRAVDPDGGPLTYSLVDTPSVTPPNTPPPAGMTIDAETGLIEWTPSTAATVPVTILISDGNGGETRVTYSIVVASNNRPPQISPTPIPQAEVETAYSHQIEASDPDDDPLTYSLIQKPAYTDSSDEMTIDEETGLISWEPSAGQAGSHAVLVEVADGNGGKAWTSFIVFARENNAPSIDSVAIEEVTKGRTYRYDVLASDPDAGDALAYSVLGPDGLTIDRFGRITWDTTDATPDEYPVEITVTDNSGATDVQSFDLEVLADTSEPVVHLDVTPLTADPDEVITITFTAVDDIDVIERTITVDGDPVPIDAFGMTTVSFPTIGDYDVVATAKDAAGNIETVEVTITVIDSSDVNAPVVSFDTPSAESIITAPVDIIGSVDDLNDNLKSYRLELVSVATGTVRVLAEVEATAPESPLANLANETIGQLDPTVLANGAYLLRLTAIDFGNNESNVATRRINVASELKLGNFAASFVDLQIPVAGIPITITRSYDSLDADRVGDFGHGWSLSIADAKLTVDRDTTVVGTGRRPAFVDGTRVIITRDGGITEGFTFQPYEQQINIVQSVWIPHFVPDPGITSRLTVDEVHMSHLLGNVYNVIDERGGLIDYHPGYFGNYTLKTPEGIDYEIDADTGKTVGLGDRRGNKLSITEEGIESNRGRGVVFTRDQRGRIEYITDPRGNQIQYGYTPAGDLMGFISRTGTMTRYFYDEPTRPHFLTEIVDHSGRSQIISAYDEDGRLESLTDASGAEVGFAYDAENRTQTVTDQAEEDSVQTFDELGNILRSVDQTGRITTWTYEDVDHPRLFTSQTVVIGLEDAASGETDDLVTIRTYDDRGNVTVEIDPSGKATRYTYDQFNQLETVSDPLGNTTTNVYDFETGQLAYTVDPLGHTTFFQYTEQGDIGQITTHAKFNNFLDYAIFHDDVYNPAANPNTDPAALILDRDGYATTNFTYNAFGDVTSVTDTYGITRTLGYDQNGNQTTTSWNWINPDDEQDIRTIETENVYDAADRLTSTVSPQGTSSTEYDDLGQVILTVDQYGGETGYVYDARGLLIETSYPDGTTSRNVYDESGRALYADDPHVPTNPTNGTQTLYDEAGRVIESRRVADLVIEIYLDAFDKPASRLDSGEPAPTLLSTSSTHYDDAGRVDESTNIDGLVTRYEYDAAGRQAAVVVEVDGPDLRTEFQYDDAGRQIASTDALDRKTRFEHDDAGNVLKTTYADGTTTTTEYDTAGRRIGATDQLERATFYAYDRHGNLTAVRLPAVADPEAAPPSATPVYPTYEYEYDDYGNQTLIRDAKGRETIFTYDEFGLQTSRTLPTPLGETPLVEKKTYTELGQLETVTDFEGRVTEYLYDDLGRVATTNFYAAGHYTPGGPNTPDQTWTYEYDLETRTDTITDDAGIASRATLYDVEGRIIRVTTPQGEINYEYDPATGRQTRTYTTDTDTEYGYDEQGRLETVTVVERNGIAVSPEEVTTYTYDEVGKLDTVTLPNGIVSDYDYDDLNRLESLTHVRSSDTVTLASYTYERYGDGRLARSTEVDADGTTRFDWAYDALGRLIEEQYDGPGTDLDYTTTYLHDLVGNRLSKETDKGSDSDIDEVVAYLYDDLDRLVAETLDSDGDNDVDQTTLYEYGPNATATYGGDGTAQTRKAVWEGDDTDPMSGTLLSETVSTYNLQGRLATATVDADGDDPNPAVVSAYEYGSDGIRVSQTVDGDTTDYVVDALNPTGYAQVLEERDSTTGDVEISYTIGHDIIAQADATGDVLYLLADGHGSTRQIADETAVVAETYDFDAFGNAVDFDPGAAVTTILYAGEHRDSITGNTDLRSRDYDPRTAQFTTFDFFAGSHIDPQSLHKYLYGHADAINNIDPSGAFALGLAVSTSLRFAITAQTTYGVYDAASRVYEQGVSGLEWTDALTLLPGLGYFGAAVKYGRSISKFTRAAQAYPKIAQQLHAVGGEISLLAGRVRGPLAGQLGTQVHEAIKASSLGRTFKRLQSFTTATSPYFRVTIAQPLGKFGFTGAAGHGSQPDFTLIFPKLRLAIAIDAKSVPKAVYSKGFLQAQDFLYSTGGKIGRDRDGTKAIFKNHGYTTIYFYLPYPSFAR